MKPLAIKSGFRYVLYSAGGEEVGHVYYPHGRADKTELDTIMDELFEVREL